MFDMADLALGFGEGQPISICVTDPFLTRFQCQLSKAVCNSSVGHEPEELAAGGDGTGVGTDGTWDVGKCAAGRWGYL